MTDEPVPAAQASASQDSAARDSAAQSADTEAASSGRDAAKPVAPPLRVIDNQAAVLGLLFGVTLTAGLPVLWSSRGFSPAGKAVVTLLTCLWTLVVFGAFTAVMVFVLRSLETTLPPTALNVVAWIVGSLGAVLLGFAILFPLGWLVFRRIIGSKSR